MKKIVLFGLVVVMGFIVSSVVNGQAGGCGPTPLGSLGCLPTTISCGFTQCLGEYTTLDETASGVCTGCEEACITPPCIAACYAAYQTSVPASVASANSLQQGIIDGGIFGGVECGEMSKCVLDSSPIQSATNVMGCQGDLSLEARDKFIKDFIGREAQALQDMEVNPDWASVLNEHLDFQCPVGNAKCSEFLSEGLLSKEFYQAQSFLFRATPGALLAAVDGGYILEQGFINYLVDFLGLKDLTTPEGIAKFIARQAVSTGLSKAIEAIIGVGSGGAEQAAFNSANQVAALGDYNAAIGCGNDLPIVNCQGFNRRSKYAEDIWSDKCNKQPNCVLDSGGGSLQCLAALPNGRDVQVKGCSLHVEDNRLKNMFTLTGRQNQGVVYQRDGFVNIDQGGTTKISVAGTGAFITDVNNNQLYIGPGTTFYYGKGDSDEDTYVTNGIVLDYESRTAVADVNAKEQKKYPEEPKSSLKQNIELAVTFNHKDLQRYKNAVNIKKAKENYEIMTRGFSDILLLEDEKVFPFVTRNYAKGDASIVMHRNVKIPNTYIVNDETYEYTIKTIGDSTKVIAKNGKIIEDSGPLNTRLSRRQNILVNNI